MQLFQNSLSNSMWGAMTRIEGACTLHRYLTKTCGGFLNPFYSDTAPVIADGLVEAERVTEPELAAVSGAGESRGFEGRSRAEPAVTSAAAPGQL